MQDIFTSPRFWLIVIVAVLQSLAVFNVVGGEQVDQLINIISLAIGGIVAIRTIDKNTGEATIEAAKATGSVTTVSMPQNVSAVTATTDSIKSTEV